MRGLSVAVAGCGPGGLAAALILANRGHSVTLFERFETPRPIGSGLMIQPTGMAVLQQLGLAERILGAGARIDRLSGKASDRVVLDVHYRSLGRKELFGVGVHRSSLFDALFDAVRAAGIPICTAMEITGSRLDAAGRRLVFADATVSDAFDLVVDALGTRTSLVAECGKDLSYGALWATLDWPSECDFDPAALSQRYRRSSVMAGILPIGKGTSDRLRAAFFWSLRRDQVQAWRETGLEAWKAQVRALWPETQSLLSQISDRDQLAFATYAHRTVAHPVEEALIHIGDAWHSASPQLGQGANMALLDAWALGIALQDTTNVGQALRRTVELRRRHIQLYQWLTAIFTPVYQSDSHVLPVLRDHLVGPMSKVWPATWIQAAMVSGIILNPLKKLGLSGPSER